MKLAILGVGMIAKEFLTHTMELTDFELYAIFSTEKSYTKAKLLQSLHNICHIFVDYTKLLESEVEVIYIALPNSLHFEFAKKAIIAGKHVIIEKPFTVNFEQAKELFELAKKHNVYVFEAITNKYMRAFKFVQELLPSLGNIRLIQATYCQYSSRYDDFQNGIVRPVFDTKQGGGVLMDLNVYNIHLIVAMFGIPKSSYYLPNIQHNIDTSGVLMLSYDGLKAVCLAAKDANSNNGVLINGDKGYIEIIGSTNAIYKFTVNINGLETQEHVFDNEHRMLAEFRLFYDLITKPQDDIYKKITRQTMAVMEILDKHIPYSVFK